MSDNQNVSADECNAIHKLADFDMTMFVSELHDHGWPHARVLLRMMPDTEDMFDDIKEVQKHAAQTERELLKPKSLPAVEMALAVMEQGCVPLVLIGGKEIGAGYRDYVIAGAPGTTTELITYIVERLPTILDGTVAKDIERN